MIPIILGALILGLVVLAAIWMHYEQGDLSIGKALVLSMLTLCCVFMVYIGLVAMGSNWIVSEGERVGVVQKVSERGAFIPTTEIEMALIGEGSGQQISRVWEASLDKSNPPFGVKEELLDALKSGTNVRIKYREVMKNAPWRMETNYMILSVERTK